MTACECLGDVFYLVTPPVRQWFLACQGQFHGLVVHLRLMWWILRLFPLRKQQAKHVQRPDWQVQAVARRRTWRSTLHPTPRSPLFPNLALMLLHFVFQHVCFSSGFKWNHSFERPRCHSNDKQCCTTERLMLIVSLSHCIETAIERSCYLGQDTGLTFDPDALRISTSAIGCIISTLIASLDCSWVSCTEMHCFHSSIWARAWCLATGSLRAWAIHRPYVFFWALGVLVWLSLVWLDAGFKSGTQFEWPI